MRRYIKLITRSERLSAFSLLIMASVFVLPVLSSTQAYFPGKWEDWESRRPEQVGMDPQLVEQAVAFALENQIKGSKDLAAVIWSSWGREPGFRILGPTNHRGDTSGMIIRHGYIVAEWGDTQLADMTFSVTKSYLSTVAALALDQGLIRDVHDPVKMYVRDGKFDSEHNAKITWHHLLQQTSDWEGTLFDTPDWADRPVPPDKPELWQRRPLNEPGTHFKYNDVRVNLLAYCLLQVWRRPLPQVLRESIMDPIGASNTWRWHGYENSWVLVDGAEMQSVSGGGHFGGGLFISTRDHARFGLLFLRRGVWNGERLFSEKWIDMLRTPVEAFPGYGYMWWLNTGKRALIDAPEHIYFAVGTGGNYIVVDEQNDLVVVVRWMPSINDFLKIVLDAAEDREPLPSPPRKGQMPGEAAASGANFAITGTWLGKSEIPGLGIDDFILVFAKAEGVLTGNVTDTLGIVEKETRLSEIGFGADKTVAFQFSLVDGTIIFCSLAFEQDKMTGTWQHPGGDIGELEFVRKK